MCVISNSSAGTTVVTAAVVEGQTNAKLKSTLKLHFKFDSMTLVLYSSTGSEVTQHDLWEFHHMCNPRVVGNKFIVAVRSLQSTIFLYKKECC